MPALLTVDEYGNTWQWTTAADGTQRATFIRTRVSTLEVDRPAREVDG